MSSIYNLSAFNPDTVTPYSNFSLGLRLPGVRKMLIHRKLTLVLHLIPNYLLSNK